jgi:4-amino-4-deoxy-L-arabinose transferase-like glycosyltransferase
MPLADEGRPGAAVRGAPSPGEAGTGSDAGSGFLLAAIVALLCARIPLIAVRVFDNDELEHAHAAWSAFQGLLPYRDFFEHHTPWYYFALSPFFRWFSVADSFDAARHFLIFGRVLSLALTALSVVLISLLGRLGGSRRLGLFAGLFLVGQPALMQKTLEIRPDVLALPFFIAALWFLLRGLRAPEDPPAWQLRRFLAGGLCLGAAVMCTQKMLFVLPGALVALAIWSLRGRRTRSLAVRVSAVLVLLLGVAAPVLATWIGFALRGGGGRFIYDNFLLNARVQLGSNRALPLILETSWPVLLLAVVGAWVALRGRRRGEARERCDDGDLLLLCTLAGFVAGIPVVRVAYEQYYLPPMTIVCLFAARGLCLLLDGSRFRASLWPVICAAVALSIWPMVDLRRSLHIRNDVQLARLRFVLTHTGPTDRVLDGWLGTNVFRPAPHYYFFMHSELWAMLTASEKEDYLDTLTSGRDRPALIALDVELRALGPRFLEFVRRDYVSRDGLFYLPVEPAR